MATTDIRNYAIAARSTDTHGRVMCSVRNHHFIIDGPVQNGAPGEEVTPAELFLTGVASCGVELVQAFAKAESIPLAGINVDIAAMMDRANPVRQDVTVFNSVSINFKLKGVSSAQGNALIERFRGR
ncbi:MAG: hypothetical protein FJY56_15320 [Betaproteobacteria bacterium]|nr:hypothetical protein [Betaproteobacteria bacterium]